MACGATLKRNFEWDPLHSPLTSEAKKRCLIPLSLSQHHTTQTTPASEMFHLTSSPLAAVSPKLTKEEIAVRIGSELKRIQRRRQLFSPASHSPPLASCSQSGPHSPSSEASVTSGRQLSFLASQVTLGASSPKQKDVPLFTLKQVSTICERMINTQEEKLREIYEKVLSSKLSEQYETFLRFNHDQLQKQVGNASMSYLS